MSKKGARKQKTPKRPAPEQPGGKTTAAATDAGPWRPPAAGSLDPAELVRQSFALATSLGPMLVVLAIAAAALEIALAWLPDVPRMALFAQVLYVPPIVGTALALAIQKLDGDPVSMGAALKVGMSSWLGILVAMIFSQIVILGALLLLIVPGVRFFFSYLAVYPSVVSGEAGGLDALRLSRTRMAGHRVEAAKAWITTFLPALAVMLVEGFLRNDWLAVLGFSIPPPIDPVTDTVLAIVRGLAIMPARLLEVVVYHKTAPPLERS